MKNLILRVLVNAVALWVAAYFVGGIDISGDWWQLLILAAIFGLVNAFIKPIVKLLTLPITLVTLGLFTLVINALMLLLTGWLVDSMSFSGGVLGSFWSALLGAIIVSIVSTVLSWFIKD